MLDILAHFDILGLGAVTGSLLYLAGLIWLLVDNRSFEELSRRHEEEVAPRARPAPAPTVPVTTALPGEPADGAPTGPEVPGPGRRAA